MPYLVNALSQYTPRWTLHPSSASLSPARSMVTSEPLCRSSFLECSFLILYKSPSCFKGGPQVSGSPRTLLSDCAELQVLHPTVVILVLYFWIFKIYIHIRIYISYTYTLNPHVFVPTLIPSTVFCLELGVLNKYVLYAGVCFSTFNLSQQKSGI